MRFLILLALLLFGCAKKPKPAATVIEALPVAFQAQQPTPDPNEQILDFELERTFPSDPIRFDLNSDAIVSPYFVERLGAWLDQHRHPIVLTGHACPLGEDDYNYNLSERRAVAVKIFLMTKFDLPGELLRVESKGETEPVTLDPALYPLNRRVEVALEKP